MRGSEKWLLLPLLLVQVASLRALAKHVVAPPWTVLAAAGLTLVVGALALGRERWLARLPPSLARSVVSPRAFVLLGLVAATLIAAAYPAADGLKRIGRGSDADDAMILGARNLLFHGDPYRETTYLDNKISPGPGWILLVAPLSLTGLYPLLGGLALAGLYALLCGAGAPPGARLGAALATLGGLGLWESLVVGLDLFPLGVALAASLYALERAVERRGRLAALAALEALLLTGRVVLPALVPVAALRVRERCGARAAWTFAGLTLGATIAVHTVFWARAREYMPWHVVGKGVHLVDQAWRAAPAALAGVACAAALALGLVLRRWRLERHADFVLASALTLSLPLYLAAFADLVAKQGALEEWEVTYILVTVPLWIYHYGVRVGEAASDRAETLGSSRARRTGA